MVSECCTTLYTALAVLAITLVYYVVHTLQGNASAKCKNREKVRRCQAKKAAAIDELTSKLDSDDPGVKQRRGTIVALPFFKLQKALQDGTYTAVQVLDAYKRKALDVTKKINCVTEFLKEAEAEAAKLDKDYAGKTKPPLFGLPFSVKDNFWNKGYSCTRGLGSEWEKPVKSDCSFVSHLRSLGAVPFCRTNVPQTLLQYCTTNPLWGTALHPLDNERNPGGSSGGECALLAAGGSAFGIGSDLGGSLRIPASFCGLTTLKPTAGCHAGIPGVPKIALSNGFFTKDAKSLKFLMETFLTAAYQATNPEMAPLPYGSVPGETKRLRIGYCNVDGKGMLKPVPSMQRAVDIAVLKLSALGHEMVPFTIPRPMDAVVIAVRNLHSDNGAYIKGMLAVNDEDPLLKPATAALKIPLCLRSAVSSLLQNRLPLVSAIAGAYNGSVAEIREAGEAADHYKAEFADYWASLKLDALVCHAFAFPAPRPAFPPKLPAAAFITVLFNLLDYPAGVIKVTEVTKEDEEKLKNEYPDPDSVPRSALRNPLEKMAAEAVEGGEGLPVGVQIVTPPYKDELCVNLMEQLEGAL